LFGTSTWNNWHFNWLVVAQLLELGKIEKQNALKIFCSLDQHKEEEI